MRIPFPDNVTWEDRARVTLPMAVVWHGNAVEVADDLPTADVEAICAALAAYDPTMPTPLEQAAALARERMAGDARQAEADAHARLLLLEQAAGLG